VRVGKKRRKDKSSAIAQGTQDTVSRRLEKGRKGKGEERREGGGEESGFRPASHRANPPSLRRKKIEKKGKKRRRGVGGRGRVECTLRRLGPPAHVESRLRSITNQEEKRKKGEKRKGGEKKREGRGGKGEDTGGVPGALP